MSFLNRRAFLKSSALGVPAAAAMASLAGPAPAAPPKPPAHAETYRLTREIPVEAGYDLVVAGGGPAGAAAAICAARLGAKVLLVEATGCLGGMGTNAWSRTGTASATASSLLVGGLIRELIEEAMPRRARVARHRRRVSRRASISTMSASIPRR